MLAIAEVLLLLFLLRLLSHSGSCPIHREVGRPSTSGASGDEATERLGKSVLPALFTQAWTQSLRSRYLKYSGTPCTDTSYLRTKVDRRVGPDRSLHNPATAHIDSPKTHAYTGSFGKKWPNRTECQAPVQSLSYPPKREIHTSPSKGSNSANPPFRRRENPT
ncbi:hypothetical protein CTAM01_03209 [Colletotrichum tamarilloi]|uniref:Secreted protein n=1 Tax=Colletotrichum tamarilloi TaxID=1209934 RepID=A0ABQ9RLB9_9PEZI|nr:uncharacterized protein CTAM01_03209 [Colletotrichum tamarilloi]KAK1506877.1 hypothetical protein CTAM01_03209 [Colletotrichum tamarilloi]